MIRPFGVREDSKGTAIDFDKVHADLIEPALSSEGFGGGTTGEFLDAGNIREDMFSLLLSADLVICDITVHNANVFYELGARHALRKRGTVLLRGRPTADNYAVRPEDRPPLGVLGHKPEGQPRKTHRNDSSDHGGRPQDR